MTGGPCPAGDDSDLCAGGQQSKDPTVARGWICQDQPDAFGEGLSCGRATLWVRTHPSNVQQYLALPSDTQVIVQGLTVIANDEIVAGGQHSGGPELGPTTGSDAFLAQLDTDASLSGVWGLSGVEQVWTMRVGTLPGGDLIAVGGIFSQVDFGGSCGLSPAVSKQTAWVARFSNPGSLDTTKCTWVRVFETTDAKSLSVIEGLTIAPDGDVWLGGAWQGTIELNGASHTSQGGNDGFVLRMTQNGVEQAVVPVQGAKGEGLPRIAILSKGNAVIGAKRTASTESHLFLRGIDADGVTGWDTSFGADGHINAIETAPQDSAYVIGYHKGNVTFGDTTLVDNGGDDAFLLRVNGVTGGIFWAVKVAGTPGQDYGAGVATTSDGSAFVMGVANDKTVYFYGLWDASGNEQWTYTGSTTAALPGGLTLLSDDTPVIAFSHSESIALPGGVEVDGGDVGLDGLVLWLHPLKPGL